MCHFGMSPDTISNSSLAFIYAINNTLPKRMCEKLGVPYENDLEDTDSLRQEEIDNDDNAYPLLKSQNVERYSGVTGDNKRKASSKEDIIRIWGDVANIQDNT